MLDYRKVRQIIIDECTAEHVNLLESLIGKLALRLMQLPGVLGVRVKIAKLEILMTAKLPFASKPDSGKPMNTITENRPCRPPTGLAKSPPPTTARSSASRSSWKNACAARSAARCLTTT